MKGRCAGEGETTPGASCCEKARRRYHVIPRICVCRGNTWTVRPGCIQSVPVLRSGQRAVYAAGADRAGGAINLYPYAPNALGWVDPVGLTVCKN